MGDMGGYGPTLADGNFMAPQPEGPPGQEQMQYQPAEPEVHRPMYLPGPLPLPTQSAMELPTFMPIAMMQPLLHQNVGQRMVQSSVSGQQAAEDRQQAEQERQRQPEPPRGHDKGGWVPGGNVPPPPPPTKPRQTQEQRQEGLKGQEDIYGRSSLNKRDRQGERFGDERGREGGGRDGGGRGRDDGYKPYRYTDKYQPRPFERLDDAPPSLRLFHPQQRLDPRHLSNWISHSRNADELMNLFTQHGSQMNNVHFANLWNKLGRHLRSDRRRQDWQTRNVEVMNKLIARSKEQTLTCGARELANIVHGGVHVKGPAMSDLFDVVAKASIGKMGEFNPQNLSNAVWAYATAKHPAMALFDAIAEETVNRKLGFFNPQNLANMVWAYATAGNDSQILFDAVAEVSRWRLADFDAQELANTVWAYATAGHKHPELFDAVAHVSQFRLAEFSPQNLANTVWAFSKVGNKNEDLLKAVAEAALARLHEFEPQALTNTVWSFSQLEYTHAKLFTAVAEAARRKLGEYGPQALSNTSWAYANAQHQAPALFDGIAEAALYKLMEFEPQNLASMTWAFAKIGHSAPILFDAVSQAAQRRLANFSPLSLANTVYGFAMVGHGDHALFEQIELVARRKLPDFAPENLANTIFGFATARQGTPILYDAMVQQAQATLADFGPEELSHTLWALAAVNFSCPIFLESCREYIAKHAVAINIFTEQDLRRLHQWQIWCELELKLPELLLPEDVRTKCEAAMPAPKAPSSAFGQRVCAALKESQWEFETGLAERGLSIAIALPKQKVAIELLGPMAFLLSGVGGGVDPTGATLLKQRQLEMMGWKVLPVPHFEWLNLQERLPDERLYLDDSIRRLVNPPSLEEPALPPPMPEHPANVNRPHGLGGAVPGAAVPPPIDRDRMPPPLSEAAVAAAESDGGAILFDTETPSNPDWIKCPFCEAQLPKMFMLDHMDSVHPDEEWDG